MYIPLIVCLRISLPSHTGNIGLTTENAEPHGNIGLLISVFCISSRSSDYWDMDAEPYRNIGLSISILSTPRILKTVETFNTEPFRNIGYLLPVSKTIQRILLTSQTRNAEPQREHQLSQNKIQRNYISEIHYISSICWCLRPITI